MGIKEVKGGINRELRAVRNRMEEKYVTLPYYSETTLFPSLWVTTSACEPEELEVSEQRNFTEKIFIEKTPKDAIVTKEENLLEVNPKRLKEDVFYEIKIKGEKYYLVKKGNDIIILEPLNGD